MTNILIAKLLATLQYSFEVLPSFYCQLDWVYYKMDSKTALQACNHTDSKQDLSQPTIQN